MSNAILTDIVKLEKDRDDLQERLDAAETILATEMVQLARQLGEGKALPPAAALVMARNELPDYQQK
jgi:hypothetical protein